MEQWKIYAKSQFYSFIPVQDWYYRLFGRPAKELRGELALITGGGGGLGRLLALRLANLGVNTVIWDINQEGKSLKIRMY